MEKFDDLKPVNALAIERVERGFLQTHYFHPRFQHGFDVCDRALVADDLKPVFACINLLPREDFQLPDVLKLVEVENLAVKRQWFCIDF